MKKYATVPYILKLKRLKQEVEKPCIKNHSTCTIEFCKDADSEPSHQAKLNSEFTVSLFDVIKFAAIMAGITTAFVLTCQLVSSICSFCDN